MWLAVFASVVAINGWLLASCLAPFPVGSETEYLLLLAGPWTFAAWWFGAMGVLVALRAIGGEARRFSPVFLLSLTPIAIAMLATPLRRYAPPWLYVGVDLRWWLVAFVALLIAVPFDRAAIRSRVERLSPRRLEVMLAAALALTSLFASPPLRFQSVLVGDEPKYLRYAENWYRGDGADVSELGAISDLPA